MSTQFSAIAAALGGNFVAGFGGSCGIELLALYQCYERLRFPRRYRRFDFWIVRLVLALGAGLIAVLYSPPNLLLAVGLGAAAPAVLRGLATSASQLQEWESETNTPPPSSH